MNLAERAAKYFGAEDEPRTSITVSRRSCFLVMRQRKDSIVLGYYSEKNPAAIEAEYWWLTEDKRKALVEALND